MPLILGVHVDRNYFDKPVANEKIHFQTCGGLPRFIKFARRPNLYADIVAKLSMKLIMLIIVKLPLSVGI